MNAVNQQFFKYKKLKGASLIQEKELKYFFDFLNKDFKEITFAGECKDGTVISFIHFEDLLGYENFDKSKLITMEISCLGEDKTFEIKFKNNHYVVYPETISYSFQYKDKNWGFRFEDDMLQVINDFKPGYSYLTYINLFMVLPVILFLVLPIFFLDSLSIHYVVYWIILIYLFSYLLNKLKNYLFPCLFIALGKQTKEYSKRHYLANIIFVIVGLGIIINLVSHFIINGN